VSTTSIIQNSVFSFLLGFLLVADTQTTSGIEENFVGIEEGSIFFY
jgi:hypothetical protein